MKLSEKFKVTFQSNGTTTVKGPHELRAVSRIFEDLDDSEIWEEIVQALRLPGQEYVAAGDSHMLELDDDQVSVRDQVGVRDKVVFTRQEFLPLAEFYLQLLKEKEVSA